MLYGYDLKGKDMANSFPYATITDVKKVLLGLDVSDIPTTLEDAITERYIPWAQRDVDEFCNTNLDATVTEEFLDGTGTQVIHLHHRPIREVLNTVLYIIPSAQWFQFKRWFYVNNVDQLGIKVAVRGGTEPRQTVTPGQDDIPPFVFDVAVNPGFQNTTAVAGDITADFNDTEEQYGKSDLFIDTKLGKLTVPPRILFQESQAVPFWNYTFLRGINNVRVEYVYGYSDPTVPDLLLDPSGSTLGNLPKEVTQACANLAAKYVLVDKGIFMGSGAKSVSVDGVSKSYGEMPYEGLSTYLESQARQLLKPYRRLGV